MIIFEKSINGFPILRLLYINTLKNILNDPINIELTKNTYLFDKKQKIVCIINPTTNVTNIGINISHTIHLTFCSDKNLFTIYNPTNKNVHILTNTQGNVAPIIP